MEYMTYAGWLRELPTQELANEVTKLCASRAKCQTAKGRTAWNRMIEQAKKEMKRRGL